MSRLAKVSPLIQNDRALQDFSVERRGGLLGFVKQRHGQLSILIASQILVEKWPEMIGEGGLESSPGLARWAVSPWKAISPPPCARASPSTMSRLNAELPSLRRPAHSSTNG